MFTLSANTAVHPADKHRLISVDIATGTVSVLLTDANRDELTQFDSFTVAVSWFTGVF
ncbi:MAG: hypothetical protein KDA58_00770 [Planctomycetaceae bacterium]|nr:hypothetical protein [Planctomycetaceae bacterium]